MFISTACDLDRADAEVNWRAGPDAELETPCGDAAIAMRYGVDSPASPTWYALPSAADPTTHSVSTTAQLQALLGQLQAQPMPHEAHDIILEDGVYDPSGLSLDYLAIRGTYRLWARNVGGAVLQFGVDLGGNNPAYYPEPPELHGLIFDIADATHAAPGSPPHRVSALTQWGTAVDRMVVADCRFVGNDVVHNGIMARQADGVVIERVTIQDFLRLGILLDLPLAESMSIPARVRDVVVQGVGDPAWALEPLCGTPEAAMSNDPYCPGTLEHGIYVGEQASIERVRIRDVMWSGILTTGNTEAVANVSIQDADIDRIGAGNPYDAGSAISFERITHDVTVSEFCVGSRVARGVYAEWNHGDSAQSALRPMISDGDIQASRVGVYFDFGTMEGHLDNLHISNAAWAGVGLYRNNDEFPSTVSTTTCSGITFDLGPGICETTLSHESYPCTLLPGTCVQ